MTRREPLRDGHGRLIGDLRLSVVDRCNFRCQYCMPADGLPWLDRSEILTFEESQRLVALLASMGVGDLRLTGGEPLVRREFPKLVSMLRGVEGLREISVTTNGYLLERDAEALVRAGVDRFNVSVDSLGARRLLQDHPPRRPGPGDARPGGRRRVPGGEADQGERDRHARLHRARGAALLRAGPLDGLPGAVHRVHAAGRGSGKWTPEAVLTGAEIREIAETAYELEPLPARAPRDRARLSLRGRGGGDRIREPGVGALLRRLQPHHGSPPTASCAPACSPSTRPICAIRCARAPSDDELEELIRDAVWRKELKHRINEPGFRRPPRSMSQIGG